MSHFERDIRAQANYRPVLHQDIPDAFYQTLPHMSGAVIYHSRSWHKVIQQGLGWKVSALAWHQEGKLPVAWLPFVHKRRLLRALNVCLPLSYGVGMVRYQCVEPDALILSSKCHPIEIHAEANHPDLVANSSLNSTTLDLTLIDHEEDLFQKFHKNHIRRKIRKAQESGIEVIELTTAQAYESYAKLQAVTRRSQGVPTYPNRFFHALWANLAKVQSCRLFMAHLKGQPVAGVIFLYDRRRAIYGYGASVTDRSMLRLGVNQLTMWTAIRHAHLHGMTAIDFGPSSVNQPQLSAYKEHWGGVTHPLYFYSSREIATSCLRDDSYIVRAGNVILKRLPLGIFRTVSGPLIRLAL